MVNLLAYLVDFMFVKSKALYQQVEDFVREKISSGEYPSGARFPSTQALAELTGTSVFTVQTALARLHRDGLIIRKAKHVTYVSGAAPKLTKVGIYVNKSPDKVSLFSQKLIGELRKRLQADKVQVELVMDDRPQERQCTIPNNLRRLIERREIQALTLPATCKENMLWLKELEIPVSGLTTDSKQNLESGKGDFRIMLELAFGRLKGQGCRTVGMINTIMPSSEDNFYSRFYRDFIEVIGNLGLEAHNDWIRFPSEYTPHVTQFGYEQFHCLWNMEKRPEGLFVFPDQAVTGVVTAALERRVSVPDELKVVFHANDLLPYPCPMPASFVMFSVTEYVETLLSSLYRQVTEHRTIKQSGGFDAARVNPVLICDEAQLKQWEGW